MKLFDPKRVFIKILLFSCLIALAWNTLFLYENDRLISCLIRKIEIFEFCYKLMHEKIKELIPIDNIEKIKQANFFILNKTAGRYGSGTHIKLSNKNYVLTCAHLLKKDADEIQAIVNDNQIYCLKLIKINKEKDLALYSMSKNNLSYLEISKEIPEEGNKVAIIGNPAEYDDVITNGIIAKKTKNYYIITNLAFGGSSGGALLYKGKIVGVVKEMETYYAKKKRVFVNYTRCVNLATIREFLQGINK